MSRRNAFAYQRFIALSLFTGLLIGSLSGAIFLFRLRLGTAPVELIQKEAHGHLQIFGFVFPLILGIAYYALPRFLGTPLRSTEAVRLSFGGAVSCVLLWSAALIVAPSGESTAVLHALAASSELLATGAFAFAIFQNWGDAKRPSALYLRFLLTGALGWNLASAGDLASAGFSLAGHTGQALAWLEAVYSATFFLAILPWTLGMTLRATAMFMRLPSPHERLIRGSHVLILLGAGLLVLAQAVSPWIGYSLGSTALEGLSLLLLAGGA